MATNTDFFKIYGASEAQNGLVRHRKRVCVYYGYGEDSDGKTYNWRKDYDHVPTLRELKGDIDALINEQTDAKILNGFKWNGKPVYLSSENQFNFKAAYDIAVQTEGNNLPVKFKLGEDEDGEPVYHTFTALTAFSDFITKALAYVVSCLNAGWAEKDGVDYSAYETDE